MFAEIRRPRRSLLPYITGGRRWRRLDPYDATAARLFSAADRWSALHREVKKGLAAVLHFIPA